MDKKNKSSNEPTGLNGTLEAAKDWLGKSGGSGGAKVQNPNQNKEIHKEALGPNAHR